MRGSITGSASFHHEGRHHPATMLEPPHPFHLRPLVPSDLRAVVAIEQHSFPTPTREKTYRYELLQNQVAHYQALTIRQHDMDEQLLGYGGYWLLADELHISTIAVDPQWRGKGLGELLLLNMLYLGFEHEASLATLEVRTGNQMAQELYRKYQFEIVGRRRHYYKDTGEDALLMTVLLRSNRPYTQFLAQQQQQLFSQLRNTPF